MLGQSSTVTLVIVFIVLSYFLFAVECGSVRVRLRNYAFNTKCLHPVGNCNGAELEVVDYSDASTDQSIISDGFEGLESNAGYIQFEVSGKCLSLTGFSSNNGVHVIIWDCVNQDNQKWSIVNGNSGGSFQLQLKSTGKCLTAEGGGTYLDQWDCIGTEAAPHQSWTIDVIDPPIFKKVLLRNWLFDTKCLHAVGQGNGAELELVDCSSANSDQIMRGGLFQKGNDADYLQFDSNGKCLSLTGFASDNGVHIIIWDCEGQDNQKWSILNSVMRGSFQLQLKSTGKCLTAENSGTYLDQWECLGPLAAPHQTWTVDVL